MDDTLPPAPPPIQRRQLTQTNLSFSQESLWFLQQLDPNNIAYNSNYLLKITGGIDKPSMERAVNEMVRRHEPLRTVYPNQDGKPIQVIQPFIFFPLILEDYSGLAEEERQQAFQRYATEHGNRPFDLERGPMTRFALLHVVQGEDYLFFCTHHIGTDAWSRQIFISELMKIYDAYRSGMEITLPDLPIQYSDYAAWQKEWLCGETLGTFITHWRNILSGDLPILDLPTDHPRPSELSFQGAVYRFRLPKNLSMQMKDFCKKEHITLFQLVLAAYALLLMRHSHQEDIIIGCPFANRPTLELESLVGLFINTLPIRVTLQGNPSVHEFLAQIHAAMLDAFAWQAAPFETLVSEISPRRDLSRTPVFQAVINYLNVPKQHISFPG